jgi:hypothetical protein
MALSMVLCLRRADLSALQLAAVFLKLEEPFACTLHHLAPGNEDSTRPCLLRIATSYWCVLVSDKLACDAFVSSLRYTYCCLASDSIHEPTRTQDGDIVAVRLYATLQST